MKVGSVLSDSLRPHGLYRILEWVVFPFSRGSSQPRDRTQVSHIAGGFFTSWAQGKPRGDRGEPNNVNGPVEITGSKVHHEFSLVKTQWSTSIKEKITQKTDIHWADGTSNTCQEQLDRYYKPKTEKAMAPHSSTLAWKIPWTEEPVRLQSMLRVRHDWAASLSLFTLMHWRRKWQPTPVFLPGESQGWGSLVGCRLWGRRESDTTEAT